MLKVEVNTVKEEASLTVKVELKTKETQTITVGVLMPRSWTVVKNEGPNGSSPVYGEPKIDFTVNIPKTLHTLPAEFCQL
jgi:hypothetical protein